MSKYDEYKVTGIRDYPLGSRKSKVKIENILEIPKAVKAWSDANPKSVYNNGRNN